MNKVLPVTRIALPVVVMVLLIPIITNDYILAALYILITIISFLKNRESIELLIFVFGFFTMIFFETIFIRTGVETFARNSLFGIMPLWLPFLWGYGFFAIRRGVQILDK